MQRSLQNLKNELLKLYDAKKAVLAKADDIAKRSEELTAQEEAEQTATGPLFEQRTALSDEITRIEERRSAIWQEIEAHRRKAKSLKAERVGLGSERIKIKDEAAVWEAKIQALLKEIATMRKDDTDWRQ
jgi:chromosome segregation ATPase